MVSLPVEEVLFQLVAEEAPPVEEVALDWAEGATWPPAVVGVQLEVAVAQRMEQVDRQVAGVVLSERAAGVVRPAEAGALLVAAGDQ